MDLCFNFSDEDFEDEVLECKKEKGKVLGSVYEARLDTPEWFLRVTHEECRLKLRLNRLKFRGDYFYARRRYEDAATEYLDLLEMVKGEKRSSLPLKREVFESLSRTYMRMGNSDDEALEYALLFHSTSNPVNPCNVFASFDLLATAYARLGTRPQMWLYCIIQMLQHRPLTPRAWKLLGDATPEEPLKSLASWLRAIGLYESVQKTVGRMAREQNQKCISELKDKVKLLGFSDDIYTDMKRVMTRDLVNESRDAGEDETFQDLGASKRLKPLEEGMQSPPESVDGLELNWNVVREFERKWFNL
eukprot:TRINITY_DN3483_c0_g1_i3.p1 TRINITY_DN3483_c0_g1~~TRINITY_DN3483_c0_g1_i3.p1  ORF type:complete len:304 (+),score=76.99 TRINITY_DN3483_c0_g1_i3:96-1007(+)